MSYLRLEEREGWKDRKESYSFHSSFLPFLPLMKQVENLKPKSVLGVDI